MDLVGVELAPVVRGGILPPHEQDRALHEARAATDDGRVVVAHNWWCLEGEGDAGHYDALTLIGADEGWSDGDVHVVRYAKFSSPRAALAAWCAARSGPR